ncbi:ALG6, ALG8 glycosyltransferase family-domain-containing protein [Suillus subluteus]|nr:ALG6, ALG8 glycosyltransferase family-domain-containing protein [Suillus subluteus]
MHLLRYNPLSTRAEWLIRVLIYLPPFSPLSNIAAPIIRIFPFRRGLFEDKVANFWCFTNALVKWKRLFAGREGFLIKVSTGLTALGFLPAVAALVFGGYKTQLQTDIKNDSANESPAMVHASPPTPILPLLLYALLTCSILFFLFLFQVHEKTILVPLLPLTLLLSGAASTDDVFLWGALGNNVGVFSMWPLLKKDVLGPQYELADRAQSVQTTLWIFRRTHIFRGIYSNNPPPHARAYSDATHTLPLISSQGLNAELNCNACGLCCKLYKRLHPKSMRASHGEGRHGGASSLASALSALASALAALPSSSVTPEVVHPLHHHHVFIFKEISQKTSPIICQLTPYHFASFTITLSNTPFQTTQTKEHDEHTMNSRDAAFDESLKEILDDGSRSCSCDRTASRSNKWQCQRLG